MERDDLATLCRAGLSQRRIASQKGVSQATVRHYLHKYGLQTRRGPRARTPKDLRSPRRCGTCGESDPTKFYGNKRRICARCHNQYVLQKGRETRRRAIEYLGGCCNSCRFDRYQAALDIHHLSPAHKDPSFNSMRNWSWRRVEAELQECVLLCKNCHAAVHSGELEL